MTPEDYRNLCLDGLLVANEALNNLGYRGRSEVHDELVVDISTLGDRTVSSVLLEFFKKKRLPAVVYSEESGKVSLVESPSLTIAFDDVDGTDNYFRGGKVLPHCTVISVFDSPQPFFKDIVAAGIIEHNSGEIWFASRGGGTHLNGSKTSVSGKMQLDKKTRIQIDAYMGYDYLPKLLEIYRRGWVKDFGSAALHLAGVSSGMFDAYISSVQKAHELGAGYLLIRETGGFLVDFNGDTFDEKVYDFGAKYSVVASGNQELGKALLSYVR